MDKTVLFLRAIEELDDALTSIDEYKALGVARILRQLLLDSDPLIHEVNRNLRLRIRYVITDYPIPRECDPCFASLSGFLLPDSVAVPNPVELTEDAFLGRPVLLYRGHETSVRDLILLAANVLGGVHAGKPKDKKAQALTEMAETIGMQGLPAGLELLREIGVVVRIALEPLRQEVAKAVR